MLTKFYISKPIPYKNQTQFCSNYSKNSYISMEETSLQFFKPPFLLRLWLFL